MPWRDDHTPPPERRDQMAAIITRVVALIVFGFIVLVCAQSWFPASAVGG